MSVHDIPGREIAERLAFIQQHPDDPRAVPGGDRRGPSHLPAPAAQAVPGAGRDCGGGSGRGAGGPHTSMSTINSRSFRYVGVC